MNMTDLKPASALALRLGVKCIGYGPPGSGKTPLSNTAPNPVMLVTEPGMLSMRKSPLKHAYDAYTLERIDEFFNWFFNSPETKNFDTLIVDSVSQMCESYIAKAIKANKHGLRAYGEMATTVMDHLTKLYYMPNKHLYLICKQQVFQTNEGTIKRPYFPGQELPVRAPHLFDVVIHVDKVQHLQHGMVTGLRCLETFGIMARDRSGNLAEIEPPDLGALFAKAWR
jgi:hypothetical protein